MLLGHSTQHFKRWWWKPDLSIHGFNKSGAARSAGQHYELFGVRNNLGRMIRIPWRKNEAASRSANLAITNTEIYFAVQNAIRFVPGLRELLSSAEESDRLLAPEE